MRPLVSFRDVTAGYGDVIALEDVSFTVEEPSLVAVVGPNGAGKTTMLRVMLGLLRPFKGEVVVLGVDVLREPYRVRRMVGYVPQRERVDPTLPVLVKDVVLMGRACKVPPGRRFRRVDVEAARRALSLVGLEDLWDEPFSHLSGGLQQRVLIARALASEPRLLLLDEPLSGVDAASQQVILRLLREMADEGVGVVMVTHDLNPVLELADYVLLLNRRLIAVGRPRDVLSAEALRLTYGRSVLVHEVAGSLYVLGGDSHA